MSYEVKIRLIDEKSGLEKAIVKVLDVIVVPFRNEEFLNLESVKTL